MERLSPGRDYPETLPLAGDSFIYNGTVKTDLQGFLGSRVGAKARGMSLPFPAAIWVSIRYRPRRPSVPLGHRVQ